MFVFCLWFDWFSRWRECDDEDHRRSSNSEVSVKVHEEQTHLSWFHDYPPSMISHSFFDLTLLNSLSFGAAFKASSSWVYSQSGAIRVGKLWIEWSRGSERTSCKRRCDQRQKSDDAFMDSSWEWELRAKSHSVLWKGRQGHRDSWIQSIEVSTSDSCTCPWNSNSQ